MLWTAARALLLLLAVVLSAPGAAAAAGERPEFVIVAMGDSFSSGEGNPEAPGDYDDRGGERTRRVHWGPGGPDSDSHRCHRSNRAGPEVAANKLQEAFPGIRVTFRSFGCSGAKIVAPGGEPDLGGLLDRYRGVQPDGRPPMEPQVAQANAFLSGRANRQIDALVMAVGINDMGFGEILTDCVNPVIADCSTHEGTVQRVASGLAGLAGSYELLAKALRGEPVGAGRPSLAHPRPERVYVSHYPDPTRDDEEAFCHGRPAGDLFANLTGPEASWAYYNALLPLNRAVSDAANSHGWFEITGLAEASRAHGVCAEDRWFNTNTDALRSQGNDAALPFGLGLLVPASAGALHPNRTGHDRWADLILAQLSQQVGARFSLSSAKPRLRVAKARATVARKGRRTVPGFIELAWADPVSFESRYELEIRRGSSRQVVRLAADTTSYVHRTSGRAVYRVRVCGPAGCSPWSDQLLASNVRPDRAPTGLEASQGRTQGNVRQLRLSFTPRESFHTHFQVRYRMVGERRARKGRTATSPFTLGSLDEPLPVQGRYRFEVRACSDVGCSGYSALLTVTIEAQPDRPRPEIPAELPPGGLEDPRGPGAPGPGPPGPGPGPRGR